MGMKDDLEKLKRLETEARSGGGEASVAKQHDAGKLTARDRIDHFFDKGSFVELNMFAQHQCKDFGMEKKRPLGDGVITGYGRVDGRQVFLYAQDFTTIGGTVGFSHSQKICNIISIARETGLPVVGLVDSGGARIQEGSGAFTKIFSENIDASGVIPQISAIMGNCAGGGVYSPALTDFIFMVENTSQMFITGPTVIKEVTGRDISMQELGGAKVHSRLSGVVDFIAQDDGVCLDIIKRLLSFLPSNHMESPPYKDNGDPHDRMDEDLLKILPDNPRGIYDMHKIILSIIDNGDFLEVKANYAKNMIIGIARLNGCPVGIVANQPLILAASIDCNASDKAARFIRTCDCFNIPLISLVDVPGYLPGVDEEHKGIIRHGAKMLYAWKEATVPKITCTVRKAYGGAYAAMNSRELGADMVFAWPSSEIAVMGAESAVRILYRKEIESADDKDLVMKKRVEEFRDKFVNPYYASSRQQIDIVIRPQETRPQLIRALDILKNKKSVSIAKKHGNIPL